MNEQLYPEGWDDPGPQDRTPPAREGFEILPSDERRNIRAAARALEAGRSVEAVATALAARRRMQAMGLDPDGGWFTPEELRRLNREEPNED